MSFTLNYSLGNAGWAEATFSSDDQSVVMVASYLHDSLDDLVVSANLLVQGAKEAKVLFMDEPGEHMIFLRVNEEDMLDVEIRWFEDWASWDLITEKRYKVVFKTKDSILIYAKEILRNLEKIFNENGTKGYKEKWINNDFPLTGLEKLRKLIAEGRFIKNM
jgi:hypothetical protein